jgi:hypothetical protein
VTKTVKLVALAAVEALAGCASSSAASSANLQVTCGQGSAASVYVITATNTSGSSVQVNGLNVRFYNNAGYQFDGTWHAAVTATLAPGKSKTWSASWTGGDFTTCKASA